MLWLFAFTLSGYARELTITSVRASSYMAPSDGLIYEPKLLKDLKSTTTWVEDDSGSGLGSWFEIQLEQESAISKIQLWNGNWYSYNQWDFYNRASRVDVFFSDGSKESFDLKDKKEVEELVLSKPIKSDSIKIKVTGVYTGSAYAERTAISEIKVFDNNVETYTKAKIKASSILPEDNDGSYDSANLQDGLKDTMWCEGTDGDGAQESLTYDFGSAKKVSTLFVVNGNGTDFKMFMGYGSVKSILLDFDNGTSQKVTIKPSIMPQEVSFIPVKTKSVKVTLNEVKPGPKVNDTCISEMRFE